jgi:hypothetical protein
MQPSDNDSVKRQIENSLRNRERLNSKAGTELSRDQAKLAVEIIYAFLQRPEVAVLPITQRAIIKRLIGAHFDGHIRLLSDSPDAWLKVVDPPKNHPPSQPGKIVSTPTFSSKLDKKLEREDAGLE